MNKLLNSDSLLGMTGIVVTTALLVSSQLAQKATFVLPGDAPPFLMPKIFLVLLGSTSILLIIGGFRKGGEEINGVHWGRISIAVLIAVLAASLFKLLGFLVVAPLSVFATMILLGYRRYWIAVASAFITSGILYLLLSVFAQMPLPKIPGLGV